VRSFGEETSDSRAARISLYEFIATKADYVMEGGWKDVFFYNMDSRQYLWVGRVLQWQRTQGHRLNLESY
jgi:hypothetical protein